MIFKRELREMLNVFNIKVSWLQPTHSVDAGSSCASQTNSLQADRPTIRETLIHFSLYLIR